MLDLSIVVPVFNEEDSLPHLVAWIRQVIEKAGYSYEILLIDDGSTDRSWSVIEALQNQYPAEVIGVKFRRNYGKSAALNVGFKNCSGKIVVTMDADLQDSPEEIPDMMAMIHQNGWDIVSGWKKVRHDPLSKTLPSKFFNAVTRKMSGIQLNDFNCGLKAYRSEVVKNIEVYGEMHRYIPLIAKWAGFVKITEKAVEHRARKYGYSKFGTGRYVKGFLDLLTIFFIGKFGKRPMHFFGTIGTLSIVIGFLILIGLSIEKLFFNVPGIASRPLFFFGILTLIIGSQLFLTGFIAELITTNSPRRNQYQIEKTIGGNG
jgi:glycosyltransferase involved in cell wall biosynthesis